MKKWSFCLLIVGLLVLLASCDLCRYPIDDPAVVKIDTRLVGKWKIADKKKKDRGIYTLTKQDDLHYGVTVREGKKQDLETYSAFLSVVETSSFLNIYCKKDTTEGYLFVKIIDIDATGNKLTVASVTDSTMKYLTNAAQVRAMIARNVNNAAFYGDTTHFVRMK